jgi:NAD(P)-dependent dehydrogenase (short-subunit alcohol dehydrogenase family)
LAVNLTSAFIIAKELFTGPSTLADRRIILLSSIYGALAPDKLIYEGQVMSNPAAYGVSKSGLEALGRYLASELGPVVKVNSIRLGGVERQQRPEFIEAYNRKTILGRMAAENDVQPALAFLLDPENSYMTGSIVDLEGGLSII